MKTMVTIEDDLSAQLASAAQASGKDVEQLVNDLLRQGLDTISHPASRPAVPFHQRTHDFGPPLHFSLDRIQHVAEELDDAERLHKAGLMQ